MHLFQRVEIRARQSFGLLRIYDFQSKPNASLDFNSTLIAVLRQFVNRVSVLGKSDFFLNLRNVILVLNSMSLLVSVSHLVVHSMLRDEMHSIHEIFQHLQEANMNFALHLIDQRHWNNKNRRFFSVVSRLHLDYQFEEKTRTSLNI